MQLIVIKPQVSLISLYPVQLQLPVKSESLPKLDCIHIENTLTIVEEIDLWISSMHCLIASFKFIL